MGSGYWDLIHTRLSPDSLCTLEWTGLPVCWYIYTGKTVICWDIQYWYIYAGMIVGSEQAMFCGQCALSV